jgi:DNA-binding transcriptional LysR family regulator
VAVCEEKSIQRAAEREHIAASALSRRLSDLERHFKLALFRRHARGLEPNSAGLALLQHARTLLRDVEQMEHELADRTTGLKGIVRLHANVWSIVQYLPEQLRAFRASHPLVEIHLVEALSAETVQAVTSGIADLGIIGSNVPSPGLRLVPYCSDRLAVVMPSGHALAGRDSLRFDDLLPYDLIGARADSALDRLMMTATAQVVKISIRISAFEMRCRMAEAGLGITLVPSTYAARHTSLMNLVSVPLIEPWAIRQLNVCLLHGVPNLAVQRLMSHMQRF